MTFTAFGAIAISAQPRRSCGEASGFAGGGGICVICIHLSPLLGGGKFPPPSDQKALFDSCES
jgi:hypothetical protein